MAEKKPPGWDEIKGLIEKVDEICRESQQIRDRAEDSMRRKPFWPERRKEPRTES